MVSKFSLADPLTKAVFVSLTTEDGNKLELTEGHHLPVGPAKGLKQARDVVVGDLLWRADSSSEALATLRVTEVDLTVADGLHNPLLKNGGQPLVDGVATSFNNDALVALDALAVPILEAACEATGTCTPLRQAIAAAECAAKHVFSSRPVCKTFHYIDGPVVRAPPLADALAALITALAVLAVSAGVARRARKA